VKTKELKSVFALWRVSCVYEYLALAIRCCCGLVLHTEPCSSPCNVRTHFLLISTVDYNALFRVLRFYLGISASSVKDLSAKKDVYFLMQRVSIFGLLLNGVHPFFMVHYEKNATWECTNWWY
jgi:hypothetical protein